VIGHSTLTVVVAVPHASTCSAPVVEIEMEAIQVPREMTETSGRFSYFHRYIRLF